MTQEKSYAECVKDWIEKTLKEDGDLMAGMIIPPWLVKSISSVSGIGYSAALYGDGSAICVIHKTGRIVGIASAGADHHDMDGWCIEARQAVDGPSSFAMIM